MIAQTKKLIFNKAHKKFIEPGDHLWPFSPHPQAVCSTIVERHFDFPDNAKFYWFSIHTGAGVNRVPMRLRLCKWSSGCRNVCYTFGKSRAVSKLFAGTEIALGPILQNDLAMRPGETKTVYLAMEYQ